MTNNLDELHSTNPKDFGKLLNKGKRKHQHDIGINKLFDFFKDLNSDSEGNVYEGQLDIDEGTLEQINSHINLPIRKDEIFKCVRKLKNEKASDEDEIINEYIKSTVSQFINVYEKLFNVIFDNAIMPSSWFIWMITPIYKNKGDIFDPNTFRPITIVSCLGKLFTAILNERLTEFSEFLSVLSENQSGFRQGYTT
jgi:hypothetical protein